MCRGAHYIGVDKRVDAPWIIVLSAFVSSRFPPIVSLELHRLRAENSSDRRTVRHVRSSTGYQLSYAPADSEDAPATKGSATLHGVRPMDQPQGSA